MLIGLDSSELVTDEQSDDATELEDVDPEYSDASQDANSSDPAEINEPQVMADLAEDDADLQAQNIPAGFAEIADTLNYPSNPFAAHIYSTDLRCGASDADQVTFKFVPETTAEEFGYQIASIARADEDGLNAVYDTSFGPNANTFSPDDEFSFNFMASGRYQIRIQIMAKDGVNQFQPTYRFAIATATFRIDDSAYPSTEEVADRVAQACMNNVGKSDYERALWLHDWLVGHCEYDYGYHYANAEGALIRGKGTCEAYHRAYVMLLKRVGIESGRVSGGVYVWTAVKMDNAWYQVDVTHDDIDYEPQADFPEERRLHFGLTDSLMEILNPGWKDWSSYPSTSLECNYLVKSGAIKNYSNPYRTTIQQKLDAGERSFVLSPVNADWGASLQKIKETVNGIVAYDLSNSSWSTQGRGAELSVAYANGVFTAEALVEGEIDSLPFYPGLSTVTGALRYGKSNGKYAQNEWGTVDDATYYALADATLAKYQNTINGKTYYFRSTGAMVRNKFVDDEFYGPMASFM